MMNIRMSVGTVTAQQQYRPAYTALWINHEIFPAAVGHIWYFKAHGRALWGIRAHPKR